MNNEKVTVAFSATEAFHKKTDEYARRLGMTRATFIATIVEFALEDKRFFVDAFVSRAWREVTLAVQGGDLYSVGPRTKSVQVIMPKKVANELNEYAERMNKSRSEVLATLAEEGFEAQRAPIELAAKPWFRKFIEALDKAGAFIDVLPTPA